MTVADGREGPWHGPRVAVVPERYGHVFSPCASIRLHGYFDRMRRSGAAEVRFLFASEVEAYRPDVIVWQRVSLPDVEKVRAIAEVANRTGARMVYDLDDDLLDMDQHRERDAYAKMVAAVRESVACADEVWCSTPNLARRVAREGRGRVAVLPNALDPELWRWDVPPRNITSHAPGLRLLYMGTRTHDDDFEFLARVMDTLHAELPGSVELYLVGVRSVDGDTPPWMRVWSPPPYIGASYPAFVRWLLQQDGLDLGVAPLMGGVFNDCKSPIKVLDYAAIGVPTLASAVPAYTHSFVHGLDCFHAPNDVRAWANLITALISDPTTREHVRAHARARLGPAVYEAATQERLRRVLSLVAG